MKPLFALYLVCGASAFQPQQWINESQIIARNNRSTRLPIPTPFSQHTILQYHGEVTPITRLAATKKNNDDKPSTTQKATLSITTKQQNGRSILAATSIATIAVLYWLYLVFGAAVAKSGILPVPDFIPLVPGWPPSDADLAPALEDSVHFFYIQDFLNHWSSSSSSDVLTTPATAPPPVVRLAVFNLAEAWVFALLPVMLADKQRLPLPVVLFTWVGALGLTNAFLAPYLAFREGVSIVGSKVDDEALMDLGKGGKNVVLSVGVGAIATAVVFYAGLSCLSNSSLDDWSNFAKLATEDRTYLAFCVDLILFSAFQPFLLEKVYRQTADDSVNNDPMPQIYKVPFVGLVAWLCGGPAK